MLFCFTRILRNWWQISRRNWWLRQANILRRRLSDWWRRRGNLITASITCTFCDHSFLSAPLAFPFLLLPSPPPPLPFSSPPFGRRRRRPRPLFPLLDERAYRRVVIKTRPSNVKSRWGRVRLNESTNHRFSSTPKVFDRDIDNLKPFLPSLPFFRSPVPVGLFISRQINVNADCSQKFVANRPGVWFKCLPSYRTGRPLFSFLFSLGGFLFFFFHLPLSLSLSLSFVFSVVPSSFIPFAPPPVSVSFGRSGRPDRFHLVLHIFTFTFDWRQLNLVWLRVHLVCYFSFLPPSNSGLPFCGRAITRGCGRDFYSSESDIDVIIRIDWTHLAVALVVVGSAARWNATALRRRPAERDRVEHWKLRNFRIATDSGFTRRSDPTPFRHDLVFCRRRVYLLDSVFSIAIAGPLTVFGFVRSFCWKCLKSSDLLDGNSSSNRLELADFFGPTLSGGNRESCFWLPRTYSVGTCSTSESWRLKLAFAGLVSTWTYLFVSPRYFIEPHRWRIDTEASLPLRSQRIFWLNFTCSTFFFMSVWLIFALPEASATLQPGGAALDWVEDS